MLDKNFFKVALGFAVGFLVFVAYANSAAGANQHCNSIRDSDMRNYCHNRCSQIQDDDLRNFCRGKCSSIRNDDMKYLCRARRTHPGR